MGEARTSRVINPGSHNWDEATSQEDSQTSDRHLTHVADVSQESTTGSSKRHSSGKKKAKKMHKKKKKSSK